ncbi:MAG: YihA family ribosome biogenesis GTP-binding protein [Clostridiales bacterium]|nr:YihA family ribosome biogenesis GTP-binding protein [Clostridiales bacterium]
MNFNTAVFEASYGTSAQLPPSDKPEIAFAGRSNVGKSSLLNRLMSRKALARVSSVPGKTVTVNFYTLDNARLADLPGYGYAKVARDEKKRWAELMESYFSSGRDIRLVVQLVDMRHPATQDDMQMMSFLEQTGIPFAVALTKSDKLNKTEYGQRLEALQKQLGVFGDIKIIPFSAPNGEGADEIRQEIEKALCEGV